MSNHWLRAVLSAHLAGFEVPPDKLADYEIRTRQLRGSEFYPCPSCFLRGEEQALELSLAGDRIDHVFCPNCKKRWDVPAPSTE
jgi:hypothetical protein